MIQPSDLFPALSPLEAKVFHLRQQGMTHLEISELLGISTRTSETILYRVNKKIAIMRQQIEDLRTTLENMSVPCLPREGNQEENYER